jgi:hypothetical protein
MEAMPQAMEILFNEAMLIERSQHLGAGHYQRSRDRIDYANGFKPKRIKTRIGELDLSIPQTRSSDFYPSYLFVVAGESALMFTMNSFKETLSPWRLAVSGPFALHLGQFALIIKNDIGSL